MPPQPESPDHRWLAFEEFVAEFRDESDRAAVILGVAKLDAVMYIVLQRVLQPTAGRDDELLDNEGPLSTFSARIAMLHRLGVITPAFARSLHLIRRIRNAFAHEVSGCRLDTGAHRDRVRELFLPLGTLGFVQDATEHFFPGRTGPSVDFRIALALMVARLDAIAEHVAPLSPGKPWGFPADGWEEHIPTTDAPAGV